jgi:hypothetical protein
LRFEFQAERPLALGDATAANSFRGAFGHAFRHFAERTGKSAIYAQVFEPKIKGGPSGFAFPPRPFVLRPRGFDDRAKSVSSFALDVYLFDLREELPPLFSAVFNEWSKTGIGPGKVPIKLVAVHSPDQLELEFGESNLPAIERLRLRFCTPTELKAGGEVAENPEFGVLFARIRDRVSALLHLYQGAELEVDPSAWGREAQSVKLMDSQLQHHAITRLSSRTGQRHSIGGFTGCADYAGNLGDFMPWLKIAYWTGVGRQTVWGKGEIQVDGIL